MQHFHYAVFGNNHADAMFEGKFASERSQVILEVSTLVSSYVYRVKGSGNSLSGAPVPKFATVCTPTHLPNDQQVN